MMSVSRVFPRILLMSIAVALGSNWAEAASSVCNDLESRLVSVQRSAGSNKAAAFGNAANQQRAEISSAEAQARGAGCYGGFLGLQRSPKPQCAGILKSIGSMKANLAKIESRRQSLSVDPATASRQKSDLLRQLGANNCGPQYASYSDQGRPRNFLERLFTPTSPPNMEMMAPVSPRVRDTGNERQDSGGYDSGFGSGRYRTLCVRTCDGYYFPISYATSRSGFAADEQACHQMCPGTEVSLYAHRNPGQDSSKALSTTDASRYADLPTAFSYRTSLNPSCTCGKSTALDMVAGGYSPSTLGTFEPMEAPVPDVTPSSGEDPETIANRKGQLDPGEIGKPNVTAPVAALVMPVNGAVRRVGPSYYYAQ